MAYAFRRFGLAAGFFAGTAFFALARSVRVASFVASMISGGNESVSERHSFVRVDRVSTRGVKRYK